MSGADPVDPLVDPQHDARAVVPRGNGQSALPRGIPRGEEGDLLDPVEQPDPLAGPREDLPRGGKATPEEALLPGISAADFHRADAEDRDRAEHPHRLASTRAAFWPPKPAERESAARTVTERSR